MSPEVFEHAAA